MSLSPHASGRSPLGALFPAATRPRTLAAGRSARLAMAIGLAAGLLAMLTTEPAAAAAGTARPATPAAIHPADGLVTTYSLEQLLDMARGSHPALAASQAEVDVARAARTTASAYPNPEVEAMAGRQRARLPGTPDGSSASVSVIQQIDFPWQRAARSQVAEAGWQGAQARDQARRLDLDAALKRRFYDVVRSEESLRNAREAVRLSEQVQRRIAVRVRTGDAPRYELIRGDAELLNAQRIEQAAVLQVDQAFGALRRAVGAPLPARFDIALSGETRRPLPALGELVSAVLATHPEIEADRIALREAEARLNWERTQRTPTVAVRGSFDRQPDLNDARLGVVVSVPLFDRREGPISAAVADVERMRATLGDRELQLRQEVEAAWRQYQIAESQLDALDAGLLAEASAALRVAESAYRSGERGILEYLDAQRFFRQVSSDLIAARADLRAADVELQRLRASEVMP